MGSKQQQSRQPPSHGSRLLLLAAGVGIGYLTGRLHAWARAARPRHGPEPGGSSAHLAFVATAKGDPSLNFVPAQLEDAAEAGLGGGCRPPQQAVAAKQQQQQQGQPAAAAWCPDLSAEGGEWRAEHRDCSGKLFHRRVLLGNALTWIQKVCGAGQGRGFRVQV